MARTAKDIIANFDSMDVKAQAVSFIGTARGLNRFRFEPVRDTRSSRANRYYWGFCVTPIFEYLSEQDEEITDKEQVHIELKRRLLGTKTVTVNGVQMRIVPGSKKMDGPTFADFIDRVKAFAWNGLGIRCPEPGEVGLEYRVDTETGEVKEPAHA